MHWEGRSHGMTPDEEPHKLPLPLVVREGQLTSEGWKVPPMWHEPRTPASR